MVGFPLQTYARVRRPDDTSPGQPARLSTYTKQGSPSCRMMQTFSSCPIVDRAGLIVRPFRSGKSHRIRMMKSSSVGGIGAEMAESIARSMGTSTLANRAQSDAGSWLSLPDVRISGLELQKVPAFLLRGCPTGPTRLHTFPIGSS